MREYDPHSSEYKLEASVGISEIAEDPEAPLIACIQRADMRMYEEKKLKKKPRNSF